jgi:Family of unknown function (DUF5681)
MTETTRTLQKPHLWGPGQSGNPAGRPKGSKNKLAESFIADLFDDWQQRGPDVIKRVAEERPHEYLKIIAHLLPKDVNLKVSNLDDLSDEQLLRKLNALTEMARPLLAKVADAAVRVDVRVDPIVDADYTDISKP